MISAAGLSRAKDRCADTGQAVQALHEGDHYQATTLLFAAARLGCEAEARALLDRGAAIDAKDREGKTALAKAAEADKIPLVRLLLSAAPTPTRAPSTVRRPCSTPPSRTAARRSRCCSKRGADPNLPGREGCSPARRRGL